MERLGEFQVDEVSKKLVLDMSGKSDGIHNFKDHIVKISNGDIAYVINKICDHAGGKLIQKGGKAICPMHNWQLDLDTLTYNDSHVCKDKLDYSLLGDGNIEIDGAVRKLSNPFKDPSSGNVTLRWLNHAAIYIACNGISIITDPWLFGPAFMTGWWLQTPSSEESIELVKNVDYIFISHNHPDHLHAETLALIDRDKSILVADFYSKSSQKYLQSLGFKNISALRFNHIYALSEGFQISALNSGDFRDDSGLYICANGHEVLLTVDAKYLNSHVLPENIDILFSSFASGASGFPLCFNDYSAEEKNAIIRRNRNSAKFIVQGYLLHTKPKYFMPYAGMFSEYSERDEYIQSNNIKNQWSEYAPICEREDVSFISPDQNQEIKLTNGQLSFQKIENTFLRKERCSFYIEKLKEEYSFNDAIVIDYLRQSGYRGSQVLQLIPTGDDFNANADTFIYCDFKMHIFKTKNLSALIETYDERQVLTMSVRAEVLMCVIENKLPWEDISIGFQMRMKRNPNEYPSDFWYHFTNVYSGQENFRYTSFCGACTVIDQRPIWVNKNDDDNIS